MEEGGYRVYKNTSMCEAVEPTLLDSLIEDWVSE